MRGRGHHQKARAFTQRPRGTGLEHRIRSLSRCLIWGQLVVEERTLGWESGDVGSNPALTTCPLSTVKAVMYHF